MVAMHWRYDKDDFMVHCQKVLIRLLVKQGDSRLMFLNNV